MLPGRLVDSECSLPVYLRTGARRERDVSCSFDTTFLTGNGGDFAQLETYCTEILSCILNTCRSAQKAQFDFSPPSLSEWCRESEFLPASLRPAYFYPALLRFNGKSNGHFIFWKSTVGLNGFRIFLYLCQHLLWLSWLLMAQTAVAHFIPTCARF